MGEPPQQANCGSSRCVFEQVNSIHCRCRSIQNCCLIADIQVRSNYWTALSIVLLATAGSLIDCTNTRDFLVAVSLKSPGAATCLMASSLRDVSMPSHWFLLSNRQLRVGTGHDCDERIVQAILFKRSVNLLGIVPKQVRKHVAVGLKESNRFWVVVK